MTTQFNAPPAAGAHPRIAVVGVGGGGCNAINGMVQGNLGGVEFIAANTDLQDLEHTQADCRIQLGTQLTGGYGAGTDPDIGSKAAEESISDIRAALSGVSMAFIAAGMGGGTGTGAVPVIARIARELDILTVGVVTKPFEFEGHNRMAVAERGVEECARYMDTSLVIANQNLFNERGRALRLADAFQEVDAVLFDAIRGVIDLVVRPGIINMDFADLNTVLSDGGMGVIGAGEAEGDGRGQMAAAAAATNPLLDGITLSGAATLLVNVTGGDDLDMEDFNEAANFLRAQARENARVKVGAASDPEMEGRVRVYVVASGVGEEYPSEQQSAHRSGWQMPAKPSIPTSIKVPSRARSVKPFSNNSPRLGPARPAGNVRPVKPTPPLNRGAGRAPVPNTRPSIVREEQESLWGDDVEIDERSIQHAHASEHKEAPAVNARAAQGESKNVRGSGWGPEIMRGNSVVDIGDRVNLRKSDEPVEEPPSDAESDDNSATGEEPSFSARGLIRRIRATG